MRKDRLFGLLGSMCLLATGCFSHGPYGHPGMYATPHTAMVSPPYGTVQSPPGTAWIPASPAGSTTLSAPEPARKAAPTSFDDADSNPGNAVPAPSDLKKTPLLEVEPTDFEEDASVERRGVRTSQIPRPLNDEQFAIEPEPAEPEMPVAADETELATSNVRSANFQTQVRADAVTPAGAIADKYGYDAETYSWLKGVVEFNPKLQVWHLTYSRNPDDTDQYGGEVTLKNPEHFKYLKSGETVRVEGQFDPQQVDRLGKPVYDVKRIICDVKR